MSVEISDQERQSSLRGMERLQINKVEPDSESNLQYLIVQLREMLKSDENNNCHRTDDEFLAKFIRIRGYNLERTYKSFGNYYNKIEKYYGELFHELKPSQLVSAFEDQVAVILKEKAKDGSTIMFLQLKNWNPRRVPILKFQQVICFLIEECINEKDTQLNGLTLIVDYTNFSLIHLKECSLSPTKRILQLLQDGLPCRIVRFYLVNCPAIFWVFFYMAKPFLKRKILDRIQINENMQVLHEIFDKNILPIEIGGELEFNEAINQQIVDQLIKKDSEYKDYFTMASPSAEI